MFNIRVYGILMTDNKEVLVSDEIIRGNYYTKFCGGGLEIGEGTIDCLKREFLEESKLKEIIHQEIITSCPVSRNSRHLRRWSYGSFCKVRQKRRHAEDVNCPNRRHAV